MAQDSSERSEKCVDVEHGGEAAALLNRYARKGRELHQQLLEQYERELASLMRDMRNGSRGVDLPKTESQTLAEENGLFDAAATASKHTQLAGCAAQFLEDDSASESTTSGSDGGDDTPAFTDDNSRSSVCSSTVSNSRSAGRVPTPAVYALRSTKPTNSEPASAPFPGSADVALEKDSAELENRVNGFWRPSNGVDAAISNVYKRLNTTMETKPAPEEPPTTPQTSEADDSAKTGFIRLDLRYNKKILNYVLVETSKQDSTQEDDKWDSYTFAVKRIFNWQNVYQHTLITIHGQELLAVVREILGGVKSLNLRTPKPEIDPKMLYVFLPDFERFIKREEAIDPDSAKVVDTKLLMEYLHKDFSQTKANLDGLLKYSEITFDLLWAIFKPNTVVYSICPGSKEPRCARLDRYEYCENHELGRWFRLHCQYIDFDGSAFLPSDVTMDIPEFPGATRIDSMHAYPLSYHKDEAAVRKRLIDLGAKFVALAGSHYRFYDGIAFRWKDKHLQRVNVYSRIMIDAAMFRKVYPSYHSERGGMGQSKERAEDEAIKKVIKDRLSGTQVSLPQPESFARLSKDSLTDEHLLIASPVVLGFSFEHKGYLEFAVANISDIVFCSSAFDKLVLPKKHKSLVQALVMNHCQQSMQPGTSFDDIIEGKGKGLVAVLHGRPGVGKTLTAESICEYLQRPLYAVGAGELGTDATTLETQLAHIVDVAHSWRAVLLLDEADVFMERRSAHELARNALVSVFLRQLERFRGILFLTTNRVENFDEAFQSRIHIAIRYNDLDSKSRKIIFQTFLDRVAREENNVDPDEAITAEPDDQLRKIISAEDLDRLCRRNLNGRQIKNIVSSAHALANSAGEKLAISHLQTVLEVTEDFQRVMNGQSQIENMMNYA